MRAQVKDPEKFDFDPKKLLTQICSLYNNLSRADASGEFARAIADDARSYRGEMFPEAALVLRQFGLMPEQDVSGCCCTLGWIWGPGGAVRCSAP